MNETTMEIFARNFLKIRGVKHPQDLNEADLMEYLRYCTEWGSKVVEVIKFGNTSEKWEALALARKALASGQKVVVWEHIPDDMFPDSTIEKYHLHLED